MGNAFYIIAFMLIILWAVGFIAFSSGPLIHILLIAAVVAVTVRLLQGKRVH